MIELDGITVSTNLQSCRNVYLFAEDHKWILSTRSHRIAVFNNSEDAETWWKKFEELRGFSPKALKYSKPTTKKKNTKKNRIGAFSGIKSERSGYIGSKGICQVCHGDGGAKGQCYNCDGTGWAQR